MKSILYIVSILTIGGAAYFSIDHSNKFKTQQGVRLETISKNKTVTAEAERTEKDLADEKKALVTAKNDLEEVTQSLTSLKASETQLKKQLADVEATIEENKAKTAALNKTIELIIQSFKDSGLPSDITLENIAEKVNELENNRKNLEREMEDVDTRLTAATKKVATLTAEADRLTERRLEREARIRRNAMEFPITAVNQEFGFVVIGAGVKHGFTPQTTLLVTRDGKLIAKVRPTGIEPTQTVADIITDSVAPGVRLEPGDRVILAKPETR